MRIAIGAQYDFRNALVTYRMSKSLGKNQRMVMRNGRMVCVLRPSDHSFPMLFILSIRVRLPSGIEDRLTIRPFAFVSRYNYLFFVLK